MHNRHLFSNAIGRQRFADQLVDCLIGLGVEYLFGMPAESVNSLVHAASRRPELSVVTTRHETAAALMAIGYAKSSGRLGVCFGTAGPGATNLVAGAYEAFVGRVPLLAISGQVPLASVGRDSFQEIDSEALFQTCTSSSVQINAASQFERFVRACVLAVHESTACHVAIPGDVLYTPVGGQGPRFSVPEVPAPALPSKEQLGEVADFLESDDLAIVLSCANSIVHAGLANELSARVGCQVHTVGARPQDAGGDTGVVPAKDVLLVGRSSPLIKQRVHPHANLLELTDRRFSARSMPYIRRIICDVEAALQTILDSDPVAARDPQTGDWRVFSDLNGIDAMRILEGVLPPGNSASATGVVSSLAGLPGAALPLGIGAALGARTRSVVVTEIGQFGQFVADLSSLVSVDDDVNKDVVVICLVDENEPLSRITHLRSSMSLRTEVAKSVEGLARVFADLTARRGPALIAVPRDNFATIPAPAASRPGERSLAEHLAANLAAPVQISDFCAQLLPGFAEPRCSAQRNANAQAPSISASALRKSGKPSAGTVAASGPALLLQLNGIYDAALDNARVLVTTVEATPWLLDARRLLDGVSVAGYVVDDPATAAATVRQACVAAAASGPGVIHLHVTSGALDVAWPEVASSARPPEPQDLRPPAAAPDEATLARAVSALRGADRVSVVAGRGAAGCADLLVELSRVLGCSVHLTMGGDSVLDSPALRAHGRIGGSGDLRAFHDVARADVLLLVGVSNRGAAFDLGASGRSIVLNLDPHAMLRLGDRDIGVLGDAGAALEAMVAALRGHSPARSPVAGRRAAGVNVLPRSISRIARGRAERAPLRASGLTRAIDDELRRYRGTSTVCADVGVNTLWVYRYITSMTRSIWSASFGTMGFAVPAAIAVARNSVQPANDSAEPALTVAVAGDGGTSVTLSQLQSAVGVAAPVVFVVVNNLALAAIKFESEIMGWPDRGSAIPDINFAQYAASIGVQSRRVDTLRDFRAAFHEAVSAPRPYLIDARCVLNDAPVQAGKKHWRQVIGFFVAWSQDGRRGAGSFREVTRAVVRGKLYEKGFSE